MRRTQIYLDDDLWKALRQRAKLERTMLSELLRRSAREKYLADPDRRRKALMGIVGLWVNRTDLPETENYVRHLRRDTRRQRLGI